MSKELPKDVIIDILSRVPTRYIVRFKSVSKSWYALFQNPNFISKHLQNLSSNSDPSFIFTPKIFPNPTSTSDCTVGLILSDSSNKSIKIPIEIDISKQLDVCGSYNGLICLSILPLGSTILLWNPATRVYKDLPISPIVRPKDDPLMLVLSFGFDDLVKDYKVVRIVFYGSGSSQVEMYSLSTNSWKEIKARAEFITYQSPCSVFLNGKFHWSAFKYEGIHEKRLIACFDSREEVFSHIMPPEFEFPAFIGENLKVRWQAAAMKQSLAVIGSISIGSKMMFEVWVMREYGVVSLWTKYRSFELQTTFAIPLGWGLKGEFLLQKDDDELVVYDSDSPNVNSLGNHGLFELSNVFSHVGSLMPINGGKVAKRTNLSSVVADAFFQ